MRKIERQLKLLLHWGKMVSGRSYYHVPQGLGRAFQPGKLLGYFNDLTAKADWHGLLDSEGLPVNRMLDGSTCHFATTIIQKALGHHDVYMLTGDVAELDKFLRIFELLVKKQDERGGWDVQKVMSLRDGLKYSAMPLGEAVSGLVRAWHHTKKDLFIEAAKKAYELMLTPVEDGGTACYIGDELYLEEYPATEKNTVLNGWIFALFGVYDLFLATGDGRCLQAFNRSYRTLTQHMHVFDSGYWSYYDEQQAMASPFYHNLHISQLEALYLVTGDSTIADCLGKWKGYRGSLVRRALAFCVKVEQKLRNPAPVVIVK